MDTIGLFFEYSSVSDWSIALNICICVYVYMFIYITPITINLCVYLSESSSIDICPV